MLPWHNPKNWALYAAEVGNLRLLEIYKFKIDLNTVKDEDSGERLIDLAIRNNHLHVVVFLNSLNAKGMFNNSNDARNKHFNADY